MEQLTPGKIFLADQRGLSESRNVRLQSTFNFGDFFSRHKQPLGNLYVFNEVSLAGLQRTTAEVLYDGYVILIPVTGALVYEAVYQEPEIFDIGQVVVLPCNSQRTITVTNPYPDDTILFFQIHVNAAGVTVDDVTQSFAFDVENNANQLVSVIDQGNLPFSISVGMFDGRAEAVYMPAASNITFAFSIAGAFEIQGRLLHERDGLGLWETPEIELEALSNNAVLLLMEFAGKP